LPKWWPGVFVPGGSEGLAARPNPVLPSLCGGAAVEISGSSQNPDFAPPRLWSKYGRLGRSSGAAEAENGVLPAAALSASPHDSI